MQHRRKRSSPFGTVAIGCGAVGLALIGGCFALIVVSGGPQPKPVVAQAPEMQAKRLAAIEKMVAGGLLMKYVPRNEYPQVHVGPAFYATTVDEKKLMLSIVYAQHNSTVLVIDGHSGKQVGRFSQFGLTME